MTAPVPESTILAKDAETPVHGLSATALSRDPLMNATGVGRSLARLALVSLGVASLVLVSGCGVKEYERRLEETEARGLQAPAAAPTDESAAANEPAEQ